MENTVILELLAPRSRKRNALIAVGLRESRKTKRTQNKT